MLLPYLIVFLLIFHCNLVSRPCWRPLSGALTPIYILASTVSVMEQCSNFHKSRTATAADLWLTDHQPTLNKQISNNITVSKPHYWFPRTCWEIRYFFCIRTLEKGPWWNLIGTSALLINLLSWYRMIYGSVFGLPQQRRLRIRRLISTVKVHLSSRRSVSSQRTVGWDTVWCIFAGKNEHPGEAPDISVCAHDRCLRQPGCHLLYWWSQLPN